MVQIPGPRPDRDPAPKANSPKADRRSARSAKSRSQLLRAAEQIVRHDGVGSLTLERVAEQAGLSKGGLLYHFSSKQELVGALLSATLEGADRRLEELASNGGPGAFATAYLNYVRSSDHTRQGAAVGIFASAALDEGELEPAKLRFEAWQDRLKHSDGIGAETALLARIVGDGLWLIDLFGLAPPSTDEREAVLDLVQRLIDAERGAGQG